MEMKRTRNQLSRRIAILLCISLIGSLLLPLGAFAASKSLAPLPTDITVTNNVGKSDTVYVSGLAPGETVIVYSAQGKKLASKKVASKKMDVSFTFSQLGAASGELWVSVTSPSMTESDKTKVTIPAEAGSDKIKDTQVSITNNSGSSDTIRVIGLDPKDVVKVYNAPTGGKLLKSGTVASAKSEITLSVSQLGTVGGSVYISVANSGKRESERVAVGYEAEGKSQGLDYANVDITNNVTGTKDIIHITGLEKGDLIVVYSEAGKTLIKSTCNNTTGELSIQLTQLGKADGIVLITRKVKGLLESAPLAVDYDGEGNSQALTADSTIIVTNNAAGTSDTIFVSNLEDGDTITVYKTADKTTTWGKATVPAGKDNVTVNVSQLGAAAGTVWVSRTATGMNESGRVSATYDAEGVSADIVETQVTIINNAGTADTIYVNGLSENDKVNVYKDDKKKTLLGSATTASGSTSVTITVAQLGTTSGSAYFSLVKSGKKESGLTGVGYKAEEVSGGIDVALNNVVITNNAGIADTVEVSGLVSGDVIKVYRDINGNELLGKGSTISGGTQVVSITQLGSDGGEVYLTLTGTNKVEGPKAEIGYIAEAKSAQIDDYADNQVQVNVANKTGSSSTLTIMGLEDYTTVKVYDKAVGGNLLGSGTAGTDGVALIVSLSSLPQTDGTVYVSLTTVGKHESGRVAIAHGSKQITAAPVATDVAIINNAGIADTITVNNLGAGDMVTIYKENSSVSEVLGSATVADGDMRAVVTVSQLGQRAGEIYISVTAVGKLESKLATIAFLAEADSKAPNAGNISVFNYSGAEDEIKVSGLLAGDVVKVYYSETGGTAIGTATADSKGSPVTVYVADLGAVGGEIFVSIKNIGKNESIRTEVKYVGESKAPQNAVVVTNNAEGTSDKIIVTGLVKGDIVKVYSKATGNQLIGSAYAGADDNGMVEISVEQLSEAAGSIYVSVTNYEKCESARVQVHYAAE